MKESRTLLAQQNEIYGKHFNYYLLGLIIFIFLQIVFACLLALALANEEADVLRYDSEVNVLDFKYGLELSNSIKAVQEGA